MKESQKRMEGGEELKKMEEKIERMRLGLGGKKTGMERGMMIMEVRKTD